MKRLLIALLALGLVAAACGGDDSSGDLEELNVAYFQGWPTPNQFGQADGSFADAVGVPINWLPFDNGNAMAEAMEAGDVDIAYSQGLTPFANAVNRGADLKLVGIAVSYSEADNCVANASLGVTRDNAASALSGATVMTPFGNITHFKFLSMMDFLGVDLSSLTIVQAESGDTTAAAFEAGDIDVGCAFGAPVPAMLGAGGNLIMTGAEQKNDIGIATYDVVAVPGSFASDHGSVVTDFLKAADDFNAAWAADPETQNPVIAQAAGMEDVAEFLSGPTWFEFPSLSDQASDAWLGGQVAADMKGQLDLFLELGEIDSVIDDFSPFVDASFLDG